MADISDERLAEIMAIRDEDIDTSDIPEWTEEEARTARIVRAKTPISLRVDHDVLAWFREGGPGHLTRMNAALRAHMLAEREEG